MKLIKTELEDCYIVEPDKFGDDRGYFSPYFIQSNFDELGFKGVVQANRSKSSKFICTYFSHVQSLCRAKQF